MNKNLEAATLIAMILLGLLTASKGLIKYIVIFFLLVILIVALIIWCTTGIPENIPLADDRGKKILAETKKDEISPPNKKRSLGLPENSEGTEIPSKKDKISTIDEPKKNTQPPPVNIVRPKAAKSICFKIPNGDSNLAKISEEVALQLHTVSQTTTESECDYSVDLGHLKLSSSQMNVYGERTYSITGFVYFVDKKINSAITVEIHERKNVSQDLASKTLDELIAMTAGIIVKKIKGNFNKQGVQ